MKRKSFLIGAVLLLVIGGSVFYFSKNKKTKGGVTLRPVQATVGKMTETVECTGTVQPMNRVEIKPPVSGRIEKLLVDEGTRVKAGQILAWMSSTDRAAILDAARAKGEAEFKHWDDAYKPTPILAPLSGIIILKNVVVGQTVDASAILYAMSDKLIVLADVDETDIGKVHLGMPATITLDAYSDQSIQGSVFQILFEGKNVSNVITYGAKIEPKNVPPFFRSQMTANIRLRVREKDNVVMLPAAAVRPTATGEKQVWIPISKDKHDVRTVHTGLENGDQVEIIDGIQEGETVLISERRYKPQQAASSSPLVMSGPKKSTSRP